MRFWCGMAIIRADPSGRQSLKQKQVGLLFLEISGVGQALGGLNDISRAGRSPHYSCIGNPEIKFSRGIRRVFCRIRL